MGFLLGAPGSGPALAQDRPLVLAFYYAWYDQSTWNPKTLPDQPAAPYTSGDRATIERHVDQAQAAGIDALIQSWYGPQTADNQTETNFRTLLDVAGARGFQAAVDFETDGPFFPGRASVTDALRALLATHAQHPAYLRYAGKPVVFFWREGRFSVDEWAAIRAQADPEHKSLWIAEGVDIAYQAVFDGQHLYSVAWSPDVKQTLADWGFRVRRYEAQNGVDRLWVATAMPGYDDTRTDRQDAFAVARRGGDYYRETWAAAAASRPDWIVITSFNEWVEGTMIEPSQTYGDLYLNLTRELAQTFKGVTPTVAPTATLTAATPAPAGLLVRANEAIRMRSGPSTEYARLGTLYPGDTAQVVGKSAEGAWWQVKLAGVSGGLGWVPAQYVTLAGDASGVPVASAGTVPLTPMATLTATLRILTATVTPSPSVTPTRSLSLTSAVPPRPAVAAVATPSPYPTSTLQPPPTRRLATITPTPAPPSPSATLTRVPARLLGATPTRSAPSLLRTTPVKQRPSAGLLWLGGGALALAAGLGGILWRYVRRARRRYR